MQKREGVISIPNGLRLARARLAQRALMTVINAAAVEDFDLGDDQKTYFVDQVAPILSDLSHVMCQERPREVAYFALQYLNSKRQNAPFGPSTPLVAENVRLREEVRINFLILLRA